MDGQPSKLKDAAELALLAVGLVLLITCSGCKGLDGGKITEGTDFAAGLNVPGTDGALSLQLINYLSGFRMEVAKGSGFGVTYSTSETNTYFGMISTSVSKSISATVNPGSDIDNQQQAEVK